MAVDELLVRGLFRGLGGPRTAQPGEPFTRRLVAIAGDRYRAGRKAQDSRGQRKPQAAQEAATVAPSHGFILP